jgi:hypothetical protein
MTPLLLFAAVILASFSIPTDIKQQTIHTITTKPVERFEIVLGRFLGFLGLMTLVLVVMTCISLLYVLRGIDPLAADESLKARVPLYGDLSFESGGPGHGSISDKATNVGREWDYRSYISAPMPGQPTQAAVWNFSSLPSSLADRKQVRCEFTFDVYRTTKGQENKGVGCSFAFQTWRFVRGSEEQYRNDREKMLKQANPPPESEIDDELAAKYGYFVVPSREVTDYHTLFLRLPGGLFRNALEADSSKRRESGVPLLQVRVQCLSRTQYVGMAKADLYLRVDPEGSAEKALFAWNFVKGAFGVWFRLALMIGLGVALSTWLSGVISMLVTLMLYNGGLCQEFILSVAQGKNIGGGPVEAIVRLARREVGGAQPLEESTAANVATVSDTAFRWFVRRVLDIIPDVDRFDLTKYVAEGFDIGGGSLLLTLLYLVGYLLPWAILAYYLFKWREIAAPT